ncbi:MAG: MarR family winged helix-turn-helix transcriptional regulator [Rhodospirillaceae bacterium]
MVQTSGYSSAPQESLDPKAVLEVCLCHHIRRGGRALTRHYDSVLAACGLTAGQFIILTAIAALQPMPSPILRHVLAMDRTTLSRTLKPLKTAGFVDISAGAGRRAGLLNLTPEGASALRQAAPLWRRAQSEASGRLGAARTGQLLSVLSAVAAALRD